MMQDNSINFYDVCKEADKYFTTHHKGKGSGWKGYQRWKNANESKFAPSGVRNDFDPLFVSKAYKNIVQNSSVNSERSLYSNGWKDLGPYRIDSVSGAYSTGLGRVICSYVHKTNVQIMYVGSRSGGFWKSTNGGTTWKVTTDTLPASGVGSITAKPTDANYVLIGVQNGSNNYSHGIYRSLNGGDTWTQTNFNPTTLGKGGLGSSFRINIIKFHPRVANLVYVCANDGLYRSTDNLTTWTKISGVSSNITQLDFHPTDNNIIYIHRRSGTDRNKVLRSLDQGLTFIASTTISGNNNSAGYFSVSNDCPDCFYFASNNGVWISKDTAKTFTFLSNPPQSCLGFAVNDIDTSKMLYGYVDVESSSDGGRTFNQVTWWSLGSSAHGSGSYQNKIKYGTHYIHADLHPVLSINGTYYVGTDGFFSKSSNNGGTWKIIGQGIGTRENYSLGASQSNHYRSISGSQDNGSSIKHKTTWIEFYGADGMEAIIHPLNDDWMICSWQYGGRRRTTNGGQNGNNVSPSGQSGSGNGDWEAPIAYNPNNQMQIFNFAKDIYVSDDFGSNWYYKSSPIPSGTLDEAAIAENNSDIIVIANGSAIYRSSDGGVNFTNIKRSLPSYSITDIAFNPKDDDNIFVTYNRYQNDGKKIYMTTNGGLTWTNITYNLGNMPLWNVVVDHTDASNIYVGAEIGVYTKPLNGTTWTLYNPNLPNSAVKELEVVNGSNTLRAAIWGRGLWEYSLVGRENYPAILTTRITDMPTNNLPKESIHQHVTSVISYSNTITSTFIKWSKDNPTFNNTISMHNSIDSTWVTNNPIPNFALGTKIFFKVYTVGNNNDTTETYKFQYTVKFNVFASIKNIKNNKHNLTVFPNPTNGLFTVDFGEKIKQGQIFIYNNLGELVQERRVEFDKNIKLDIQRYSKGNYFIQVKSKDKISVVKIIKK